MNQLNNIKETLTEINTHFMCIGVTTDRQMQFYMQSMYQMCMVNSDDNFLASYETYLNGMKHWMAKMVCDGVLTNMMRNLNQYVKSHVKSIECKNVKVMQEKIVKLTMQCDESNANMIEYKKKLDEECEKLASLETERKDMIAQLEAISVKKPVNESMETPVNESMETPVDDKLKKIISDGNQHELEKYYDSISIGKTNKNRQFGSIAEYIKYINQPNVNRK